MNPLLTDLKSNFLEAILRFLWRQWTVLGVPGYSVGDDSWCIDPEALLLFSLPFARYDARLFDEILNWLVQYGDYINIQRLNRIQKEEFPSLPQLLSAVAAVQTSGGKKTKWSRQASVSPGRNKMQNLFFSNDGLPISHFGVTDPIFAHYGFLRSPWQPGKYIQPIQIIKHTGLIFKLRALFGVNARADIILYLLTHDTGHPRKIARECYFFQKTVQDALVDMSKSGIISVLPQRKEKHYRLIQDHWFQLLQISKAGPTWINWPLLFSALQKIWLEISSPEFFMSDELLLSSELRQLMKSIRPNIELSGLGLLLADDVHYLRKAYTGVFIKDINNLLSRLGNAK